MATLTADGRQQKNGRIRNPQARRRRDIAAGRRLLVERLEDRRLLDAGPYPPAAGQPDTTAIAKDAAAFVGWATGWENYFVGDGVDAAWQTPEQALGRAAGDTFDIVSLGRGGEITLTFDRPITNGPGWDFAVFENGVSDTFLELGFVEVSSDGTHFVRIPNDSLTLAPVDTYGSLDPTNIDGYAGKYRQGFGTPFDLDELADADPRLDIDRVTHVKILDIPGDGLVHDTSGDPIYDPYPTTGSGGFDLDAVGVLHYRERTVHFEDVGAGLPEESAWSGPDPEGTLQEGTFGDTVQAGGFQSGGLGFNNIHSLDFGSWTGWAYSNTTDTTSPGYDPNTGELLNPFSAYAGSGAGDSRTYAVASVDVWGLYPPPTIERTAETEGLLFQSLRVTNTTYAALSMLHGDSFAKKFGGDTGNDPDWFLLTIEGKDIDGSSIGTIEFHLADYRYSDNSQDYIIDEWTTIDISSLAAADKLEFTLTSSDTDELWGMNTPAFLALDNVVMEAPALSLTVSPASIAETDALPTAQFEDVGFELDNESFYNGSDLAGGFTTGGLAFNNDYNADWGTWSGWAYSNTTDTTTAGFGNQYSAFPGEGAFGSATYGVAYAGGAVPAIQLTAATEPLAFQSLRVTNTTYAALAIRDGDAFSKKFGGDDGTDPDWFLLTIEGLDNAGTSVGTVDFYLADYRFADSAEDYIVDTWTEVDVSGLAGAVKLAFSLSSSDASPQWGMNTPAYFAVDHVVLSGGRDAPATGIVHRNLADLSDPLLVHLNSSDDSELRVPAAVTIPAGQASASFDIWPVADLVADGTQSVQVAASAESYQPGSAAIEITEPLLWQSATHRCDVNADGMLTPLDALLLVNALNRWGGRELPVPYQGIAPPPYVDAEGNNLLEPHDLLAVIDAINQHGVGPVPAPSAAAAPAAVPTADAGAEGESRAIWRAACPAPTVPQTQQLAWAASPPLASGPHDELAWTALAEHIDRPWNAGSA